MRTLRAIGLLSAVATMTVSGATAVGHPAGAAVAAAPLVQDSGEIFQLGNSARYTGEDGCTELRAGQVTATADGTMSFGGGLTGCTGVSIGLLGSPLTGTITAGPGSIQADVSVDTQAYDPFTDTSSPATVIVSATWRAAGPAERFEFVNEIDEPDGCRTTERTTTDRTPATVTGSVSGLGVTVPFTAPRVPIPGVAEATIVHSETVTSRSCPPRTKDDCRGGGWQAFTVPHRFKNQGDCIQYVNTGR